MISLPPPNLGLRRRGLGIFCGLILSAAVSSSNAQPPELLPGPGRVTSAFNTLIYRRQKVQLQEETMRLNEKTLQDVTDLRNTKTTASDVILARTEIDDTRAQLRIARSFLVTAVSDLRRQLGIVDLDFDVVGSLEAAGEELDVRRLTA